LCFRYQEKRKIKKTETAKTNGESQNNIPKKEEKKYNHKKVHNNICYMLSKKFSNITNLVCLKSRLMLVIKLSQKNA
jgi:hypothetical protein